MPAWLGVPIIMLTSAGRALSAPDGVCRLPHQAGEALGDAGRDPDGFGVAAGAKRSTAAPARRRSPRDGR